MQKLRCAILPDADIMVASLNFKLCDLALDFITISFISLPGGKHINGIYLHRYVTDLYCW